ncbi:protocadherin-20-like [Scleropages formosus]|uniref:Protocadherin-20 n=1 Tax=Scleropages formosus TaxID=113540 RepID=A0A0P7Z0M6_SCLFO|nr:protocadherin-20-like [Scleropages formosus]
MNHYCYSFQGLCILLLFISPFPCFSNFSQAKEIVYKIKEGLPKGKIIGAIGADLELDFSVDPPLLFNLALKKFSERYVSLNSTTGELYTSENEMDREALCPGLPDSQDCFLALDVFILPQQYFQLVKIRIIVEDINDNKPSFPVQEIHVSVPENAQVNSRFAVEQSAVDPDAGIYGVQTYWLVNDYGVFTLDVEENDSGELTPFLIVTGPLDRETKSEYTTSIIAEDGGSPPLLGTATLKIMIIDVNDNCPQFTESEINATVNGNSTVGTHIARVHAYDPDQGENAQITYVYSERVPIGVKDMFSLDKVTGVIKLASKIDTNTSKFYKLSVLAKGPGCIPALATLTLHVIKVVFGPPALMPRYIAHEDDGIVFLKESEPANSPVAFFTVKNTDRQQQIDCHLEGDGPFKLSPYKQFKDEYLLETTNALDYEKNKEYELSVVVKNYQGVLIKMFVKIQVIDENDNAPIFEQSLVNLFIEENNPPNMFLTKLHATDKDSKERGEVVYLLGSDAPSIFALDRVTGVLVASTSLDREEKEKYSFTVRAVDRGTPRQETFATVTIMVLDQNDNSPRFINKDFTFFIPENFPGFGEIGVLSVTDADSGKNGWVALSIVNGSDIFVIDTGRGVLRAKNPLDREQQGTYYLWIEAVDGGEPSRSCVTMVTVLLLDVNDNPPTVLFPQSNQSYMLVLPNTLPGTSITEVYAIDKDTGMNAVIVYSIIKRKGGEPGSFDIDPNTGNITLRKTLNYRGLYSLLVKVSDHGQPEPLYTMVMVNFFVNETVSNESYIQNLLTKEADMEMESIMRRLIDQPSRNKDFPCQTVLIGLSTACLGLLLTVITQAAYMCSKRVKKHRKRGKRSEAEIPLKINRDFQTADRGFSEMSNI